MSRKVVMLISFVLMLILAGNAPAAVLVWDNGGTSNLWSEPTNWDLDIIPTSADTAQIFLADANCVIDATVNAECLTVQVGGGSSEGICYLDMTGGTLTMDGNLSIAEAANSEAVMVISGGVANMGTVNSTNGRLRVGYSGTGTLIMTGGELNVYDKIEIGRQASGVGTVYVYGGTMNFSGNSTDLELGTNGNGAIYQYGGVINVQDNIKLTQTNPASVARLYLYGGVMTAGNLRDPAQVLGDALMDITEGSLALPGDYTEIANTYLNNGWITAYGGLGIVDITYSEDLNQTIITGIPLNLEHAQLPNPKNGAIEVPRDVVLSFRPGELATAHNVFIGTNADDVNNATLDDPLGVTIGQNLDVAAYDPPGLLDYGQTYYWRVDEINDSDANSPWKGDVWSFTVLNYPIVIDDFEDYNDYPPNEIWNTWIDGYGVATNGATSGYPDPDFNAGGHYMETEIVRSGLQSMPIFYDNAVGLSEVTRTLNAAMRNWTSDGVVTLTLFYYGNADNAVEPMYVALNGSAVVVNPDANATLAADWTQWDIPLQSFADKGVNLTNVSSISIGLGNKAAPQPGGGSGHIFVDDIRLYLP